MSENVKNNNSDARLRAKMITSAAQEQYKVEVDRLNLFISRFNDYVEDIVTEFPCDKTRKNVAIAQILKDILTREESVKYTAKDKIADAYKLLEDVKVKEKKSMYGSGENGFNMDDVLNPKEQLDLKSLLSELGVTK